MTCASHSMSITNTISNIRRLITVLGTNSHPNRPPPSYRFIKGRQLFSNVRRLFNILYSPDKSHSAEVLISLNAYNAFDWIEYEYLFATLERFGFGPTFCSWDMDSVWFTAGIAPYKNNFQLFSNTKGDQTGLPPEPTFIRPGY